MASTYSNARELGLNGYQYQRCTILALIYLPAFALACMALFIVCAAYQHHCAACKETEWLPTAGLITRLNVESIAVKDRAQMIIHYQPSIYYEYTVQGKKHIGSFRPHLENDREKLVAEAYLTKFHIAGVQEIYFDPARPDDSVLVRENENQQFDLLWKSAAVFVCSMAAFIWSARKELQKFSPVPLGGQKRAF